MLIVSDLRPLFRSDVSGIAVTDFIVLAKEVGSFLNTVVIKGEKVFFGNASRNSDIVAKSTNILNKLRIGEYSELDGDDEYALEIGNGTAEDRSNAMAVTREGIPFCRNPDGDYASIFDLIYPVGCIYLSVNSVHPANLFGGSWERIEDRFLLASGSAYSAGATGGEALHTLTVAEMPSHTHTQNSHNHTQNSHNHTQNQHRHSMGAIWSDGTGSASRYVMSSNRGTQTRYTA